MPEWLRRIRDRKVVQWGVAYLAAAWVALQVLSLLAETWSIDVAVQRGATVALLFGFLVALVLGWNHGEQGRQRVTRQEAVLLSVLVVAGIGAAAVSSRGDVSTSEFVDLPPVFDDGRPAVAVLPFTRLGEGAGDSVGLSAGLHGELVGLLSQLEGVRVIARRSVAQYAGTSKPVSAIANELGVQYVMEGEVQTYADLLRVRVELADARSQESLWGGAYERELTVENLLTVQKEIAGEVVRTLQASLSSELSTEVESPPTADLQAYAYYVRGNLLSAREVSPEDAERAVEMYQEAVARAPDFGLAHAALARARSSLVGNFGRLDQAPLIQTDLANALRLAPDERATRTARGYYDYYVRRDYQRALSELYGPEGQAPQDADAWTVAGWTHRRLGEWDRALRALFEALALDPRSYLVNYGIAQTYRDLREFDRADEYLARAMAIAPDIVQAYATSLLVSLATGDTLEARRRIDASAGSVGPGLQASLRATLAYFSGRPDEASAFLAGAPEAAGWRGIVLVGEADRALAVTHHLAGRREAARQHADSLRRSALTTLRRLDDDEVGDLDLTIQRSAAHADLGVALAILGDAAGALEEGRRAVELLPVTADGFTGPHRVWNLAGIHALLGNADGAEEQLRSVLEVPAVYTPSLIRSDPVFSTLLAPRALADLTDGPPPYRRGGSP